MNEKIGINEGIVITGGEFKANDMAVGKYALIQKNVDAASESLRSNELNEIAQKINDLAEAVKLIENSIDNYDDLIETTERISRELSEKKPDKFILSTLLDKIAVNFGSLTTIVSHAKKLKDLVLELL